MRLCSEAGLSDILIGLGLLLFIEGAIWALFPEPMKRAAAAAIATDERILRNVGVVAAVFGVLLVWLVR